MPTSGAERAIDILFVVTAIGVVALLSAVAFVGALEAWRQWSDNRRIRKHLRH
jgi:hypothetical protein